MESPIKEGDVVYLKSGGPPMTVRKVANESVTCHWFVNGNRHMDAYPANTLTLVDPSAAGTVKPLTVAEAAKKGFKEGIESGKEPKEKSGS